MVEIGAGLGALTGFLAPAARRVIALERDPELARFLAEELLAETPGVEVICQDVLKFDFPGAAREAGRPLAVVGNLPYQITSPLLFTLIRDTAGHRPGRAHDAAGGGGAPHGLAGDQGLRDSVGPGTVPFPGDPPLCPVAGQFLSPAPGGFGGAAAGPGDPGPRRPWTRPCCTGWSRPPSATAARP